MGSNTNSLLKLLTSKYLKVKVRPRVIRSIKAVKYQTKMNEYREVMEQRSHGALRPLVDSGG